MLNVVRMRGMYAATVVVENEQGSRLLALIESGNAIDARHAVRLLLDHFRATQVGRNLAFFYFDKLSRSTFESTNTKDSTCFINIDAKGRK